MLPFHEAKTRVMMRKGQVDHKCVNGGLFQKAM